MKASSHDQPDEHLGILVPVWKDYGWIAPMTLQTIHQFWNPHPPVWFAGPRGSISENLPCLEIAQDVPEGNWCANLLEGIRAMKNKGFEWVYLVAEEHIPLALCHSQHLNRTLPDLMKALPAVYISLMGWDNRRFASRSPVLGRESYHLKHLVSPGDPRFHLHPALWRLDVLGACCELALRAESVNGSAWHFEKINDRDETVHPPEWKSQCYQIDSGSMRLFKSGRIAGISEDIHRAIYMKLQALYPMIPGRERANRFARLLRFDDVFCNGPYPLFFSGIMSKGEVNPYFRKFLSHHHPEMLQRIMAAAEAAGFKSGKRR